MHRTTLLALLLLTGTALATEDTEENRRNEVERYFSAFPVDQLISELTESRMQTMPPGQKEFFKQVMKDHFNVDLINQTMKDAMVREMTVEEISALADFYEQPVAKSALRKSSFILSELMPVIRAEAQRAAQAALVEQQGVQPDVAGEPRE